MELRFNIDDDLIEQLRQDTKVAKAADIGREGVEMLQWVIAQNKAGRQVSASKGDGVRYVPTSPIINNDFPYAGE